MAADRLTVHSFTSGLIVRLGCWRLQVRIPPEVTGTFLLNQIWEKKICRGDCRWRFKSDAASKACSELVNGMGERADTGMCTDCGEARNERKRNLKFFVIEGISSAHLTWQISSNIPTTAQTR